MSDVELTMEVPDAIAMVKLAVKGTPYLGGSGCTTSDKQDGGKMMLCALQARIDTE